MKFSELILRRGRTGDERTYNEEAWVRLAEEYFRSLLRQRLGVGPYTENYIVNRSWVPEKLRDMGYFSGFPLTDELALRLAEQLYSDLIADRLREGRQEIGVEDPDRLFISGLAKALRSYGDQVAPRTHPFTTSTSPGTTGYVPSLVGQHVMELISPLLDKERIFEKLRQLSPLARGEVLGGPHSLVASLILDEILASPKIRRILDHYIEEAQRTNPAELSLVWDPDLQRIEAMAPEEAREIVEQAVDVYEHSMSTFPHGYYLMDDVDGRPIFITDGKMGDEISVGLPDGTLVKFRRVYKTDDGWLGVYKAVDPVAAEAFRRQMKPVGLGSLAPQAAVVVSRALREANLLAGAPFYENGWVVSHTGHPEPFRHGYCDSTLMGVGASGRGAIGGGYEGGLRNRVSAWSFLQVLNALASQRRDEGKRIGDGLGYLQSTLPGFSREEVGYLVWSQLGLDPELLDYMTQEELESIKPALASLDVEELRASMANEIVTEFFTPSDWRDVRRMVVEQLPWLGDLLSRDEMAEEVFWQDVYAALEALEDGLKGASPDQAKQLIADYVARIWEERQARQG